MRQNEKLDASLLPLIQKWSLAEILESLSRVCIQHSKTILNNDRFDDDKGNVLTVLWDFSRRIKALAISAAVKNPLLRDEYLERREGIKLEKKRSKRYYDDDEEID
jgi:hypothetical protein